MNTIRQENLDLFFQQLEALASVGLDAPAENAPSTEGENTPLFPSGERCGRSRLALTDADREARDLLCRWMREAGLTVRVDAVGNIFGLWRCELGKPVVLGSHIDTVAHAGALDGAYGVLGALCAARELKARNLPLAVAAFTNEEGVRFQPDMLGSLVFAGGVDPREARRIRGVDGALFGEELERIGYAGPLSPRPFEPAAYLELHVEQGPTLDAEKIRVGAVTGVQGIHWERVRIRGQANHAGATPTRLRRDPMRVFARILEFIRRRTESSDALITVGSLELEPGLINVIPAELRFTADIRHPDPVAFARVREDFSAALLQALHEENQRNPDAGTPLTLESELLVHCEPTPFHPRLIDAVERAAQARGLSCRRMVSGAGHDAQMMARICPTSMIFVPSVAGLSHCPEERTFRDDLIHGVRLLADVAAELLAAN